MRVEALQPARWLAVLMASRLRLAWFQMVMPKGLGFVVPWGMCDSCGGDLCGVVCCIGLAVLEVGCRAGFSPMQLPV